MKDLEIIVNMNSKAGRINLVEEKESGRRDKKSENSEEPVP